MILLKSTWFCWLGHLARKKPIPDMTYNVFGGMLNLALSIYLIYNLSLPVAGIFLSIRWYIHTF